MRSLLLLLLLLTGCCVAPRVSEFVSVFFPFHFFLCRRRRRNRHRPRAACDFSRIFFLLLPVRDFILLLLWFYGRSFLHHSYLFFFLFFCSFVRSFSISRDHEDCARCVCVWLNFVCCFRWRSLCVPHIIFIAFFFSFGFSLSFSAVWIRHHRFLSLYLDAILLVIASIVIYRCQFFLFLYRPFLSPACSMRLVFWHDMWDLMRSVWLAGCLVSYGARRDRCGIGGE